MKACLVPQRAYIEGGTLSLQMVDGRVQKVPLAWVHIKSGGTSGNFKVGVLEMLPEDVLLGNDMDRVGWSLRCMTSVQSGEQAEALSDAENEMNQKGVHASPVYEGIKQKAPVNETCYSMQTESSHCNEVKQSKESGVLNQYVGEGEEDISTMLNDLLDMRPEQLKMLQDEDETLSKVKELVLPDEQVWNERTCFFRRNGILYRKWQSIKDEHSKETAEVLGVEQLVVPKPARVMLLKQAHEIPLTGHLGIQKTKARILSKFYWPGVFKEVADYCRTCTACQKKQ